MTQPPQVYADDLGVRLREHRVILKSGDYNGVQLMWAWRDMIVAADAISTLRAEKQVLVDRVFELEEFAENVRHESCQALAGKDT